VINFKLSGIAGGAAFILSFLIGIISGAGFPLIVIRALLFGAAFFTLAVGAYWLISQFLPDLIADSEFPSGLETPGSRVNISVEDGEAGMEEGYAQAQGLDQGDTIGYTRKGDDENAGTGSPERAVPLARPAEAALPAMDSGETADLVDHLPDLEIMSDSFLPPAAAEDEETPAPSRSPSGNKPQNLGGDFNVKEMASAIQTILKRD
jgi:hypothetical protein